MVFETAAGEDFLLYKHYWLTWEFPCEGQTGSRKDGWTLNRQDEKLRHLGILKALTLECTPIFSKQVTAGRIYPIFV